MTNTTCTTSSIPPPKIEPPTSVALYCRGPSFGPTAPKRNEGQHLHQLSNTKWEREGRATMRDARQACPCSKASAQTCVQRLDGSRDSAIHPKYRISLRSSSMREPR
uniref:Uncharacterized protein n=1 Tax=Nelumbo nucifera TaxID=4432 RepID=A0A822ZV34_NELNU|nr:TPA_asm: hypothetical protein HUJ06_017142 [Nelumbo nucifera]